LTVADVRLPDAATGATATVRLKLPVVRLDAAVDGNLEAPPVG
jgi:hypothetical protein